MPRQQIEPIIRFLMNLRYSFNIHKPLLMARLARAVIRSWLGRPPLRYVDFAINFACNLQCDHCFATVLKRNSAQRLTVKDYSRVAEECMKLGCVNFSFQGGEPLLDRRLYEIIAACKPEQNVISVTTNGTLFNTEVLEELKSLGVDILTVSLDSGIPEEHDAFRGMPGAFEKTLSGIKEALNANLKVTVGCVVTRKNLRSEGLHRLFGLTKSMKLITYAILPVPAGKWIRNKDILLQKDDLAYLYWLTSKSRYLRTDMQANFGQWGCGAGKEILYITPYGDALPCPFMHITFGNVLEESVGTIRRRMLKIPELHYYHKKCLVSSDKTFIDSKLSHTFEADSLPISHDDVWSDMEYKQK